MTAEEKTLPASTRGARQPLSTRIREVAQNIGKLLTEYSQYRYGDEENEIEPAITLVSDPDILIPLIRQKPPTEETEETSEKEEESELVGTFPNPPNPFFHAVINMGEMIRIEALQHQAITKIGFLRSLGVQAIMECSVLINWSNGLAKEFTYLLELKTTYSEEMKAKYSELLTDINVARGLSDQFSDKLAGSRGQITVDDYHKFVGKLLRYARIVQGGALQLADSHDEIMTRGISPLEEAPGIEWVIEKEKEKPKAKLSKEKPSE